MIHPLKITSILADETRYKIYEYLLQEKKAFNVQAVAEHFNIHPNVARLHLTKLSEIHLVSAVFVKSGKGGRPGREYKATDRGIELSFPKNDESRLIKWAVQLIEQIGPEAIETAKNISYKDGNEQMKLMITNNNISPFMEFEEKLELLSITASMIGYVPQIVETNQGKQILFSIYNCPFKNQLSANNEIVCILHESYLKGQIDALFDRNTFSQTQSMIHNCDYCKYEIEITDSIL